jgi:hypothetical protein
MSEEKSRPVSRNPRPVSFTSGSIGRYAATRFSTILPVFDPAPNPIRLLGMLNLQQWLFFLVGSFLPCVVTAAGMLMDSGCLSRMVLGRLRLLYRLVDGY